MSTEETITLYCEGTPNPLKISIALEELGLKYNVRSPCIIPPGLQKKKAAKRDLEDSNALRIQVRTIKLFEHEQKEQWFLDINPNGRIPAIVDTDESGHDLKIWESGAILQYLVDRYDKDHKISYPHGSKEYWQMTSWVSLIIPIRKY